MHTPLSSILKEKVYNYFNSFEEKEFLMCLNEAIVAKYDNVFNIKGEIKSQDIALELLNFSTGNY